MTFWYYIDKDQSFVCADNILKAILECWNRTQEVSKRDIGKIGSKSIYVDYRKLSNKSKSNRKETVKPNTLNIVLNLAKFFYWSFQSLNYSKKYGWKINNISIRLSKSKKIIYIQKFSIIDWQMWVWIFCSISLPLVIIYLLDNYK